MGQFSSTHRIGKHLNTHTHYFTMPKKWRMQVTCFGASCGTCIFWIILVVFEMTKTMLSAVNVSPKTGSVKLKLRKLMRSGRKSCFALAYFELGSNTWQQDCAGLCHGETGVQHRGVNCRSDNASAMYSGRCGFPPSTGS